MAKRNENETVNEKKGNGSGVGKILLGALVGGGLAILGGTVAYSAGYMSAASDVTKFVDKYAEKRKEGIEG